MKHIIIVCPDMEWMEPLYEDLLHLANQHRCYMRGFMHKNAQKAELYNNALHVSMFLVGYPYINGLHSDYHYIMNCAQETSRWHQQLYRYSIELSSFSDLESKIKEILLSVRRVMPEIKNVIFNDPATIVFWNDGTKTVVKAQEGDIFDPEKGLAMAISKKALGNKGNYCNELKKWLPKEEEPWQPTTMTEIVDGMQKLGEALEKTFGVKAKKSCSTCKFEHALSAKCISCRGRGYVNHTPKNETEAK